MYERVYNKDHNYGCSISHTDRMKSRYYNKRMQRNDVLLQHVDRTNNDQSLKLHRFISFA